MRSPTTIDFPTVLAPPFTSCVMWLTRYHPSNALSAPVDAAKNAPKILIVFQLLISLMEKCWMFPFPGIIRNNTSRMMAITFVPVKKI